MEKLDAALTAYQTIETVRLALAERHRIERSEVVEKRQTALDTIGNLTRKFNDGDIVEDRRGRQYFITGLRTEVWVNNTVRHTYSGRKVLKSGEPGVRNETLYDAYGFTLVKKAGE